jgi:hypothetical protein
VLFSFNVLYELLSKLNIKIPDISLKGAVIAASLSGFVYSVGIGIVLGFRYSRAVDDSKAGEATVL